LTLSVVPYAVSSLYSKSSSYPTSVIRDLLDRMEGLIEDGLYEMEQVCAGFFEVNSELSYSKTFATCTSVMFLYAFEAKSAANIKRS